MFSLARRFAFLCLLQAGFVRVVFSQETCEQSLNQAAAEFDAGRFYSLPTLLKRCLEGGFTNEQRFRAYYLLAQAYLVLDDPIGAEDSYLKLLKENPEFVPSVKTDPIDLVYLSRKFTTRPKFTPHYRLGANLSMPRVIYNVNTFSGNPTREKSLRVGFQIGAGVDWNINDKWSVGIEANLATKSHRETVSGIAVDDRSELIDGSTWLDIPLMVKYSDDSGKWRPFGYAGVASNLLLSSSGSFSFSDYSPTQGNNLKLTEGPDEVLSYKRNFLNRSMIVGGGVKYKIGKDFVYVDARYMIGLNNITIPEKNYYKSDGTTLANTITEYQYTSDFFRLDNLSLSFGYIRPIYDPRKVKRANANGFFRRIFQSKSKKK